jgi:uncharacterized membrane protein YdbT with pleckstrin-like domain
MSRRLIDIYKGLRVNECRAETEDREDVVQPNEPECPDSIIINEAQLILAEKRTSLAALRTGIAVFALPLSVLSLLIVTSKYYDVVHVIHFIVPLVLLNLGLVALGSYLVIRAVTHIRHYDRLIRTLKSKHSKVAEFID